MGVMQEAKGPPQVEIMKIDKNPEKFSSELLMDSKPSTYQTEIVWENVLKFIILHALAIAGVFMVDSVKHFMCMTIIAHIFSLGINAGAHRLWCHRTYKAKLPLRIFLMLMNCGMMQDNLYIWSRDHRVHHKYTDTDADPYNSKRGLFFSHMGWLMVKKHPDVKEKGKCIDLSDVLADPVIRFQMRFYIPLCLMVGVIIPTLIPHYLWNIELYKCFCFSFAFRYVMTLHFTWFVNSAAHKWGYKPYNEKISSAENYIVSYLTNGEGFHNYHHTFPWDYSTSEYGWRANNATLFIDFMAWLGMAYDRKKVSPNIVEKFKSNTKSQLSPEKEE